MALSSDKKLHADDSKPYRRFQNTWDVINHRRRTFVILCVFGITNSTLYLLIYHWNAILMFIAAILLILYGLFSLGFLRSICLHDITEQPFRSLFGLGKRFFWREVGAYLLLAICLGIILLPGIILFEILHIEDYGIWPRPATFIAYALLIKLFLFVPMLIIVLDCSIRKAFHSLKHISIRNAMHLVALSLGISFLVHLNVYTSLEPEHYRLMDNVRTILVSSLNNIIYLIIQIETIQVIVSTSKVRQINVSTTSP